MLIFANLDFIESSLCTCDFSDVGTRSELGQASAEAGPSCPSQCEVLKEKLVWCKCQEAGVPHSHHYKVQNSQCKYKHLYDVAYACQSLSLQTDIDSFTQMTSVSQSRECVHSPLLSMFTINSRRDIAFRSALRLRTMHQSIHATCVPPPSFV